MNEAIEIARRIVHQWDHYDRFRVIPEEGTDDPPGVVVSRALLKATAKEDGSFYVSTCPDTGRVFVCKARVDNNIAEVFSGGGIDTAEMVSQYMCDELNRREAK